MDPYATPLWLWVLVGVSIGAAVGYIIGERKGKPTYGAIIGAILGVLGWLLVAVASDDRPRCSECKGVIDEDAKCKHCGEDRAGNEP